MSLDTEWREPSVAVLAGAQFFASSPHPCFLLSVEPSGDFIIQAVNFAYERLTGLVASQVVGKSPAQVLPPELVEEAVDRMAKCVQQLTAATFDDELMFPTGHKIWQTSLVPLSDSHGRVVFLAGFAHDLTEQRRAELELRASENRYRNLIETLHEGIWQIDAHAITTFANPRMAQMLGYEVDEMLGKTLFEFMDSDGVLIARGNLEQRAKGVRGTHTFEFLRKDGTRLQALVATSPIYDAKGAYAGAVAGIQDLTAVRRAETDRLALERKLQETQKLESLGVLAGGIAHDFNNILTGILGSASLARMENELTPSLDEYLGHVELSAQRAAELCKQMLAYAGKGRFLVRRTDLSQLVSETTELLRLSMDKSVSVRFDLTPHLPAIEADRTQLRQILMNLVINASEAITSWQRPGIVTLATGVQHVDDQYLEEANADARLPAGRYVFLEVADNGPGMPPETSAKIFDPFYSTKFTGRGLGLSAVLGIVRGHRGAIKVYSEPNKGTTFKVLFPAAEGSAEHDAEAGQVDTTRFSGWILVVDDEAVVRRTVSAILVRLGFTVASAPDGAQAVQMLKDSPHDFVAVLMDLTMPQMDGVATFRELRRVKPDLKMILMSGYNEQDAISRFAGKGLAGFLQKPFSAKALAERLAVVLG